MDLVEEKAFEIFFPYAYGRQKKVEKEKTPFVHYTSAEAAISIITNKQFWMRDASCMNDISELRHGLDCMVKAYDEGVPGQKIKLLLNDISPNIVPNVQKYFGGWHPDIMNDTYLSCFSEHDEEKEGYLGRLSMWRAYSQRSGVALVLNSKIFFEESDHFSGLYTSPVAYLNRDQFQNEMLRIVDLIEENKDFVVGLGDNAIANYLFRSFMFATLCTKHPGFEEEREWRLTYSPSLERSDNLYKDRVCIGSVPQIIYKIPIEPAPEKGLSALNMNELLRYIIIGPTTYPLAMYKSFVDALTNVGVENASERVRVSQIPLRA